VYLQRASAYLNISNYAEVDSFLRSAFNGLPVDASSTTYSLIFDQSATYCVETGIQIWQPCQVQSCAYWTDTAWARNCILHYLRRQRRDSLDVKELAFLLAEPTGALRKRLNNAMMSLRRQHVQRLAAKESEDISVSDEEDAPTNKCCVCAGESTMLRQGYRYCGRACIDVKPPEELRVETDFNLGSIRLIQICLDSFATKRQVCHALGISVRQLDSFGQRHRIDISCLQ